MDLKKLSPEQIDEMLRELLRLKASKRKPADKAERAAKRATVKERAKANKPRPVGRKGKRKPSISTVPATKAEQALEQTKRSLGSQWLDDSQNPAVELLQSESQVCARLNVYHQQTWTSRRLGEDVVAMIVKLRDGTQETRKFSRGVLDAEWKRC
jgi:sRNA-binding protein